MVELLVTIAFLLWCAAAICVWAAESYPQPTGEDIVRNELLIADDHIEAEYRQARRAMNDAAGQSWRNLAG